MVSDFDAIYQEYGKTVYCFLLSLSRDETLSEELTQETMFRAIMNISSFRGDSKISVWLCQIAKNLYLEWMKKNKRIVPIDESIDLYDSGRDIAAELADKDIADRILQHLHELEEPYELLWRWAKRRHPKKNKWWISTRYWHRVGNRNWVFSTENKELIRVDSTAIVRHTKIKATANPFLDEAYFQKRKFDKEMHRLTGKFKMIWKNQNGLCYHCGMPMDVTEEREIFYLAPKAKAGMEDVRNMRYVHCTCQRIYAENRLKK
jgi:RNA polymerase sigma factor (sigma-70 family)